MDTGLSLSTLDWLGFDLDHTIIRYNIPALEELIYRGFSRYMVSECGYPDSLLDEPYDGLLASRGLAIDLNTGYTVKMDLHHRVVKAYFGRTRQIDSAILAKEYPAPLEEFSGEHCERFLSINTFFESAVGLLWMNLIEVLHRESKPLDFQQMRTDLFGAFAFNFARFPEGFYFPEIIAHPEKYLFKRGSVVRWLKHLQDSQGIKIFLLTNSNALYTQVLCNYCLGEDWADSFDLVLFYGRKPGFWRQKEHPAPFLPVAWNAESGHYETQSQDPTTLTRSNKFYERGNVHELCKYLESTPPRSARHHVAYVGDSIHGDCIECKRATNWSTIAVIEELEHPSGTEFHSGNHPMWGNYFSTIHEHEEPVRTYWAEQVSQYVDLAVPCLSSLEDFLVDHEHQHTHDVLRPCAILPLNESSRERYYVQEHTSAL